MVLWRSTLAEISVSLGEEGNGVHSTNAREPLQCSKANFNAASFTVSRSQVRAEMQDPKDAAPVILRDVGGRLSGVH